MEFLINPDVAYVLIVAAVLLALTAIVLPGTGIPEVGLAFCLLLAGYTVYRLGVNAWAVVVLALSIIPFVYALRATRWRLLLLVAAILLLIGGSVFLFTNKEGWPIVNPVLAGVVSLVSGGFIWIAVERSIVAMHRRPNHDLDALIGQSAEAKTAIHADGSVQADGELWSARSEKPIKAGSAVRVVAREGFVLVVEQESK
jgi:membrane-bound serine protease (ClpP class)